MDVNKIKYFESKYNELDKEEFSDLLKRRGSLADEAAAALEKIASDRGIEIRLADQSLDVSLSLPPDNEEKSRELWKSFLRSGVATIFVVMLAGPVSSLKIGTFPVVLAGLFGWLLGYFITKDICADENVHYVEKRAKLKGLLWLGLITWFFLTFAAQMFISK
jgi:hypothetical protein